MSGKPAGPPTAAELAASVVGSDEFPHRVVEWPGRMRPVIREKLGDAGVVALVILSRQEKFEAKVAATNFLFKEEKLDAVQVAMLQPEGLFEFESEIQLLAKVLRHPSSPDTELFSAHDLRTGLSTEQQEALMRLYNAYERDESPLTQFEDPEKVKGYLRSLKAAGGLSTFIACSDFGTGSAIARSLAELWLEQPSESCSGS